MADETYTWSGVVTNLVFACLLIGFATGCQTAFAPTVRVTCPARAAAAAPDCEMRWLIAFDRVAIRTVALPGVKSIGEVESTGRQRGSGRGSSFTVYLQTAAGPVRTILWGDQMELQWFRQPLETYLLDPRAPPLAVTMWPSKPPIRQIANVIHAVGLLCLAFLPQQIIGVLRRRRRS